MGFVHDLLAVEVASMPCLLPGESTQVGGQRTELGVREPGSRFGLTGTDRIDGIGV